MRTRTSSASRSSQRTWPASTRSTNEPTWHGILTIRPEFPPFLGSRGRLLPEGPIPQRGTAEVRTAGEPSTDLSGGAPSLLRCEDGLRSEEHTSELQSPCNLVCRLLLEKK